jgi:hypothetical protein
MVKDIEKAEKKEPHHPVMDDTALGERCFFYICKSTVKVARFFHMAIIRSIYTTINQDRGSKTGGVQ